MYDIVKFDQSYRHSTSVKQNASIHGRPGGEVWSKAPGPQPRVSNY